MFRTALALNIYKRVEVSNDKTWRKTWSPILCRLVSKEKPLQVFVRGRTLWHHILKWNLHLPNIRDACVTRKASWVITLFKNSVSDKIAPLTKPFAAVALVVWWLTRAHHLLNANCKKTQKTAMVHNLAFYHTSLQTVLTASTKNIHILTFLSTTGDHQHTPKPILNECLGVHHYMSETKTNT